MSDHKWFQNHIECALADGLDEAQRKRFDDHAETCDDCAAKLAKAEKADDRLVALFSDVRPKSTIDEQVIGAIPTARPFERLRSSRVLRYAAVAAGILILALVGWSVQDGLLDRSHHSGDLLISFFDSSDSMHVEGRKPKSERGFNFGVDSVGGTVLTYEIDKLKDVDQLAGEIHGLGMSNDGKKVLYEARIGRQRKNDPPKIVDMPPEIPIDSLLMTDIDPSALTPDGEFTAGRQRKEEMKLPGLDKPSDETTPSISATMTPPPPLPPGKSPPQKSSKGQTDFGKAPQLTWFRPGEHAETNVLGKGKMKGGGKIAINGNDGQLDNQDQKQSNPNKAKQPTAGQKKPENQKQPKSGRKIIRSGEMDFEVESFDKSVATIQQLVKVPGFVATINSDRLPNGKVRGAITVRVPPEHLDELVLNLRKELGKTGTLKSQRIGSQDITKQYTDMESRLRAARTMEGRLIDIIKTGKGEVKDLLLAEKELGVWRTKIEELEGELRYYSNLVALSTLTIHLEEKEIRQVAFVEESERVQAGMEVDDVEKTMQEVLAAVKEKKGRVLKSELKQHGAGQYNAVLHFEVAADDAGVLRDRLRQLGNLTRLQIDRVQSTPNGNNVPRDAKVKYGDTQFFLSIYNLANVAPRETVTMRFAAKDVAKAYHDVRDFIVKSKGKVRNAQLNEQDQKNITARLDFDIRRSSESQIQALLAKAGVTVSRQSTRVPESENVTDEKVLYNLEIMPVESIPPRETVTMKFAAKDVVTLFDDLRKYVSESKGKVQSAQVNETDRKQATATLNFEVAKAEESEVRKMLDSAGVVLSRNATRTPDMNELIDAKVLYRLEIVPITSVPPREIVTFGIEVDNVKKAVTFIKSQVKDKGGRSGEAVFAQSQDGRVTGRIICDVPLSKAAEFSQEVKSTGKVRVHNVAYNTQSPNGDTAVARFSITMSNQQMLVPEDEGLWASIRNGLSVSLRGLLSSLSFLIIGVLFVLPWLLIGWVVIAVVRRMWRSSTPAVATAGGKVQKSDVENGTEKG